MNDAAPAKMPASAYVQAISFFIVLAVALFASAGALAIADFWIYLAIWAAVFIGSFIWIDPGLARERCRPNCRATAATPHACALADRAGGLVKAAEGAAPGSMHWLASVIRIRHIMEPDAAMFHLTDPMLGV